MKASGQNHQKIEGKKERRKEEWKERMISSNPTFYMVFLKKREDRGIKNPLDH